MKRPAATRTTRALGDIGGHLGTSRRLLGLTAVQLCGRANVTPATLSKLEAGKGSTLTTFLDVTRALGVLDDVVAAVDPLNSDIGRARAEELLPRRVRP